MLNLTPQEITVLGQLIAKEIFESSPLEAPIYGTLAYQVYLSLHHYEVVTLIEIEKERLARERNGSSKKE